MSRIAMIGSGYVGLVTGACLADLGHDVTCVDVRKDRVDAINAARSPIHEAGLDELLRRVVGETLRATERLDDAITSAEVVFIAVGTPSSTDGIDLGSVQTAAEQIGRSIAARSVDRPVIVVKSTVVPGTSAGPVTRWLEEASGLTPGVDFGVAVNPEFLTEGQAIADFMDPDRIVVGSDQEWAASAVMELYSSFGKELPRITTTSNTAELIKYVSNSLLATMISFSNEMANLAAAIGDVDIVDVMNGVHTSRYLMSRVGESAVKAEIASFLEAGCGYGGSCLPKDTAALSAHGRRYGVEMAVLDAVRQVNDQQPEVLVSLVKEEITDRTATVAVLGLAFKPDTDDVRESPAFPVIHGLRDLGYRVIAHDPVAIEAARAVIADTSVELVSDLSEVVGQADALVVVTRWREYEELATLIGNADRHPLLVDGRRIVEPRSVPRYSGIGRG